MNFWEILLIGIGLSMDAAAVSTTNGMAYPDLPKRKLLAAPLLFGLFQAGMPCLGYFAGGLFSDLITKYAGVVVLVILSFIGGNMIKEGLAHGKKEPSSSEEAQCSCEPEEAQAQTTDETQCQRPPLTCRTLVMQAIATSIDAFAVGVGLSAMGANLFTAASIIGVTTFLCSLIAYFLGRKCGDLLGNKAELLGGAILVMIGFKAIL